MGQDQLRLIDDQTFETLEVMPLQRYEMACFCISTTLSDDPTPYYIVGTAYAIPDEQEPSKVKPCCLSFPNPPHYTPLSPYVCLPLILALWSALDRPRILVNSSL